MKLHQGPFFPVLLPGLLPGLLLALLLAFPVRAIEDRAPPRPEPVRVLLLDYHAPTEHDILLSHLCVTPCRYENGCPAELVKDGVDYWSEDFIVYRPAYLGKSARFVVDIYKKRRIDLLSISGHHASGFSGELGRGRFHTEKLRSQVAGSPGAEDFFTSPSLVFLQGCRTDVKSTFDGDPIAYVRHVIEETRVRGDEFERLLAAVQQIGGVQRAYRDLFPNACLLGYSGTQTPGGRTEIYRQISNLLRRLAIEKSGVEIAPRLRKLADESYDDFARRVDAECPRGWPCDLCRAAPDYYRPQAAALVEYLRDEHRRLTTEKRGLTTAQVDRREALFDNASFYANTRWSCSSYAPGRSPVWPDPVNESPFGRLFVELLWIDLDTLNGEEKRILRAELAHRLGGITFTEEDGGKLRAWLLEQGNRATLEHFLFQGPLLSLSTFRQRDFFAFLANIGCVSCLENVFRPETPSILRENAASRLRPELGEELFRRALTDPDPRVREEAAKRGPRGESR